MLCTVVRNVTQLIETPFLATVIEWSLNDRLAIGIKPHVVGCCCGLRKDTSRQFLLPAGFKQSVD